MRRLSTLVTVLLLLVAGAVWAPAAWAACHAFQVEASPQSVAEGGTVNVTVSRDAAVDDSSVQVRTQNGTAQSGSDFGALNQRVSFTGDSTEQTVRISIASDGAAEPSETFTISLGEPQGCEPNTNYRLGAPVVVTIQASQGPAAPPPPPPPPPPAPRPPAPAPAPASPAAPPSPSPTPEETEEPTPEATETPSPDASPAADDEGGGIPPQALVGVLALLGAGGVGYWLYRNRTVGPPV